MNERFEELKRRAVAEAAEADTSHIDFDNMSPTDIRMLGDIAVEQKFAELIVKECVEVVKWTPSLFPNDEYVKNIKEHFGVEE